MESMISMQRDTVSHDALPNVSVVVVSFNGERFLQTALSSLIDQSYPTEKIETIFVDNGSTDNTSSIIKKMYPTIEYRCLDKNYGFGGGFNRAVQCARYEYIVCLNVDTVCHRDWLFNLIVPMEKNKQLGVGVSNIIGPERPEYLNQDRNVSISTLYVPDISPFGYAIFKENKSVALCYTRLVSGCSFVIRKSILQNLGYLFEEDFWIYAEDTDLSLRLLNLEYRIAAIKDSVVYQLN